MLVALDRGRCVKSNAQARRAGPSMNLTNGLAAMGRVRHQNMSGKAIFTLDHEIPGSRVEG